jgi:hypothetical protein
MRGFSHTDLLPRNPDRYALKYVPHCYRTPSAEEIAARRIARELKLPTQAAIQAAAPEMALLIDGPCWLIPVPASDGSLTANLELARAIARFVPGARVKCAISRKHPVQSSFVRMMLGLPRLTIEQHAIVRIAGPLDLMPAYFVDNVTTTGTTVAASRRALGWGKGLAYADASKPFRANGTCPSPHERGIFFQIYEPLLASPFSSSAHFNITLRGHPNSIENSLCLCFRFRS